MGAIHPDGGAGLDGLGALDSACALEAFGEGVA